MFRINKLKPHFSKCKQFLDFAATAIIFVSLSLWILQDTLPPFQGIVGF